MNLSSWRSELWRYIESNYVVGEALYLSFDAVTLDNIYFAERGSNATSGYISPIDSLNAACSELYSNTHQSRWSISPDCFETDSRGRSFAICIVAQQILAAELMISDGAYSADSYYIRYRELLGLTKLLKQSPIEYAAFERLWSVVADEILTLNGASNESITFQQGNGAKNKYRNFPISQSLLDGETLQLIHAEVNDIDEINDASLLLRVRRLNSQLSVRAQTKLATRQLHSSICSQIRNFKTKVSHEISHPISIEPNSGESEVRLLSSDLFLDEYRDGFDMGIRLRHSTVLSGDDFVTELVALLQHVEVVGFHESNDNEWEGVVSEDPLSEHSCTLFISQPSVIYRFIREKELEISPVDCRGLPDGYVLLQRLKEVEDSATLVKPDKDANTKRMSVSGGLCVDRLRKIYLCGYPPTELFFSNKVCQEFEMVKLDGELFSWSEAKFRLAERHEDFVIRISYREEEIQIEFRSRREGHEMSLGHKVSSEGLQLIPSSLKEKDLAYAHLSFINLASELDLSRALSQREAISLLNTPDHYWVFITKEEVEVIKKGLSPGSVYHLRLMKEVILKSRAPSVLVLRL